MVPLTWVGVALIPLDTDAADEEDDEEQEDGGNNHQDDPQGEGRRLHRWKRRQTGSAGRLSSIRSYFYCSIP